MGWGGEGVGVGWGGAISQYQVDRATSHNKKVGVGWGGERRGAINQLQVGRAVVDACLSRGCGAAGGLHGRWQVCGWWLW